MRPTGKHHLGHLVGALENWVALQGEYDNYHLIADYHALTTNPDSSRIARVSGAVSISLDLDDLWRNPAKTPGLELLNAATVSIDELDDISLVSRSY